LASIELVGGNARIPKLQEILQSRLGVEALGKHLNGDESFVSGATLYAAIKSGVTIRPEMRVRDFFPYDVIAQLQASVLVSEPVDAEQPEGEQKERVELQPTIKRLFDNSRPRPTKNVAIQRESDFTFDIEYSDNATLPEGTEYVTQPNHQSYQLLRLALDYLASG